MISLMNYNVSRKETGKSQLADIERAYLKSLMGKELTKEKLEQIEGMLVTDSAMMDSPEMYSGLERVRAEFENLKSVSLSNQANLGGNYTM